MDTAAIFFDVGYTLIHPDPSWARLFLRVCADLGMHFSLEQIERAQLQLRDTKSNKEKSAQVFSSKGYSLSYDASCLYWSEFYRQLLAKLLDQPADLELIKRLWRKMNVPATNYCLYPDVVSSLKQLSYKGLTLGTISNWEPNLRDVLKCLNIAEVFKHVTISSDIGIEKPDPRIFTIALEKAGFKINEVIYVGDNPEHDIEPARELGIFPILLDRLNKFSSRRDTRVQSLTELTTELFEQGLLKPKGQSRRASLFRIRN